METDHYKQCAIELCDRIAKQGYVPRRKFKEETPQATSKWVEYLVAKGLEQNVSEKDITSELYTKPMFGA
jgi:hypothetical protein